jgi:hypothetical protein
VAPEHSPAPFAGSSVVGTDRNESDGDSSGSEEDDDVESDNEDYDGAGFNGHGEPFVHHQYHEEEGELGMARVTYPELD